MKRAEPIKGAPRGKGGFTLIEMLVAALLLGMLISMLTMVFTASASAWRLGEGGAWGLRTARRDLSACQRAATDALPHIKGRTDSGVVYISSVWVDGSSLKTSYGNSARRGYDNNPPAGLGAEGASGSQPGVRVDGIKLETSKGARNYLVGAGSAGPDGEWDTDDDITSWPEDK